MSSITNLADFDNTANRVEFDQLPELDQWALAKFEELKNKVTTAYDTYEFHSIYHNLNYFCGTTMSSFYLDILKDRLYTSGTDSHLRRSAQTALFEILTGLLKLMHPILSFTTAEAWDSLQGRRDVDPLAGGIYFAEFPEDKEVNCDQKIMDKWEKLLKVRSEITKALEIARREKVIGHSLEAKVSLSVDVDLASFIKSEWQTIKEISIISEMADLDLASAEAGVRYASEELTGCVVQVEPASGEKGERCWIRSTTVGENSKHPEICDRCAEVVTGMGM